MSSPKIVGSTEHVSFNELGIKDIIAKIDTGAYSGALHATNIKEVVDVQGPRLDFWPLGKESLVTSTYAFRSKLVRWSNGHVETRYIIQTTITIQGVMYPIIISLSNRASMRKPVLVGRQFLRRNGFLVDVNKRPARTKRIV